MELTTNLNDFISFLSKKGRSRATVIAYKKDIEQLIEYLAPQTEIKALDDITTQVLDAYVDTLKVSGQFTLKTVSRKINSLKTFFKYLLDNKLIVENYAMPVKHPTLEKQLPRVLSPLEYRALRDTARSNLRLYTMVELLLQTGIRIGELSRLQTKDVVLKGNDSYLRIEEFSTNPARKVALNANAQEAIRAYINKTNLDENAQYFFNTKSGSAVLIRNIRTSVNRAFQKAGIKNATVNDIRNTFIVMQLQNGMEVKALAEIVGHRKSSTTERYLELVEARSNRRTNKIEPL